MTPLERHIALQQNAIGQTHANSWHDKEQTACGRSLNHVATFPASISDDPERVTCILCRFTIRDTVRHVVEL
jgi:hypothetical protein